MLSNQELEAISSNVITWTRPLTEMIPGLWLKTRKEILLHCGSNCLWWQHNLLARPCQVYQSVLPRHPAPLSCGKSRLLLAHSPPQTDTHAHTVLTKDAPMRHWPIICTLQSANCRPLYNVTTDLYINNLDTGLASLSIANGDPLKLTSPAQHSLRG